MNFGFLLFPNFEELDLIGPWEMIGMWSKFFHGPEKCLTIAEKEEPVICAKGLSINCDVTFQECPSLDYLLIPGGQGTRYEVNNETLINFVKKQHPSCRAILSVCTGAFILERAGLLKGRRATTHWASLAQLRQCDGVEVIEERIVHDGNIWTAAGVSAGIDLALSFISHIAGDETAGSVQLAAEYYPSDKRFGSAHLNKMSPQYLKR